MRKCNSTVTVWDLCSGVCAVYMCACVCICAGGVKVTLNCSAAVCVSMLIPLERVRWRLSSASTSICKEGTNKLLNTTDSNAKLSLIWIPVHDQSTFYPCETFKSHLMFASLSCNISCTVL